jgi:hypothetical protein
MIIIIFVLVATPNTLTYCRQTLKYVNYKRAEIKTNNIKQKPEEYKGPTCSKETVL